MAHSSALELVRGTIGFSPLIVVGPPGSGKTRLLEAIAADRISRRQGASIALIPAESFVTACHEAGDLDDPDAWADLRGRFRNLDLLALDDLHALNRSPLALAELTPMLDDLEIAGASVALTVRDDPGRWDGWPRRLADRLRSGMTVRLQAPGPSIRRRYLLDRIQARGLHLTGEAIDALVESSDGYRTIDGWLTRLALAARVERRPLDRKLIESILSDEGPIGPERSIAEVARIVARHFGVQPRDLRSSSRRAALVVPRHLAILLAREVTGASFSKLGAAFGKRDPKTIRHACKVAADRLASDPSLEAVAAAIRRQWS